MDNIELPDDQKLVDLALSPATLDVAQDVLEAAPELTTDIVLFIEPNSLPPSIQAGLVELANNPARPGSFKLLSPNEDIDVGRLSSSQGAWLVRYEQDETLQDGQFVIDPVVANDLGKSEDLRHGRLDILVRFKRPCEAFRALGHILAATRYAVTLATVPSMQGDEPFSSPPPPATAASPSDDEPMSTASSTSSTGSRSRALGKVLTLLEREETANFETLGALVDVSRNGVLRVDSVKFFLRQQALIGCSLLHLYTEETYAIPSEPFFGYFRGPYTQQELRDIDEYAYNLGIELVPCIQTLAHLSQLLQWPRYAHLRDTTDCLCAEYDPVYALIEKMIYTISAPLRSQRIHIGMDEAFGMGEGRYRAVNPQNRNKPGTRIFVDHLKRVNSIVNRLGLKALIWSDMLFCLAAEAIGLNGYYETATPKLMEQLPADVDLVFWSYYHTLPDPYAEKIRQHHELIQKPPWMASGLWTWGRFWCSLPFTFETVRACMKASKAPEAGVKHCITTIWCDEGNEADIFSCLPGLQYFAEHAYTKADEVDVALVKLKFDGITGGSFDSFVNGSKLDDLHPEFQPAQSKAVLAGNMSKWLLWEDPFYAFLSPQYSSTYNLEAHYSDLVSYLLMATAPGDQTDGTIGQAIYPFNSRLKLPYYLAQVLALKCHLRDWLFQAYRAGDKEQLRKLGGPGPDTRLGMLRSAVESLWLYHRDLWMSTYKPFGWAELDIRYGALRARLDTMQTRIAAYLDEKDTSVTQVEELEVQTYPIWSDSGPSLMLDWGRAARATAY